MTLIGCPAATEVESYFLTSEETRESAKKTLEQRAQKALRMRNVRRHIQLRTPNNPTYLTDVATDVVRKLSRKEAAPSLEVILELGELLFEHEFSVDEGMIGNIERIRGHDSNSCASCHWQSGVAGSGAVVDNSFLHSDSDQLSDYDSLNPPSLRGVGIVDLLAREMTEDLHEQKKQLMQSTSLGVRGEVNLSTKGVSFGILQVTESGALDYSKIEGIDNDLVIKPFRWKGTTKNLEAFIIESLISHMGYDEHSVTDRREIFLTWLLASLPPPEFRPVKSYRDLIAEPRSPSGELMTIYEEEWIQGSKTFKEIGCASCHLTEMPLRSPVFSTKATHGVPGLRYNFAERWGLKFSEKDNAYIVHLFSDLKRHDLGEKNSSLHYDRGVPPKTFMTRRLWDLANSAPYMHDGRASWISHAIAEHGGEASPARQAYLNLPKEKKAELRVFLMSLQKKTSVVVR